VDVDYDLKPDFRYDYEDTDGDGFIDTWKLDTDNDGQPNDTWTATAAATDLPYTWPAISETMTRVLAEQPEQLYALDMRLRQAAQKSGCPDDNPVWRFVASGCDVPALTPELRVRLLSSRETRRFWLDTMKDLLIAQLKAKHDAPEFWKQMADARGRGDAVRMCALVETEFGVSEAYPECNAFFATLLAKYDQPRVAWAQDWVPPNIGWESEKAAYRVYWGQFDCFGKTKDGIIYPGIDKAENYHVQQDWGMDMLHVDDTGGIGGLTLYVNGTAYPAYSPGGKGEIVWTKKFLEQSPDHVSVELTGAPIGPKDAPYTVRFRCSALAGRKDSPIEALITGGAPNDALEVGIGLRQLRQEKFASDADAGVMGNWGVQEPGIGTVGLGVVFPKSAFVRFVDTPKEHQAILKAQPGTAFTYHIQSDWLRGRRFNCCPELVNWMDDLRVTARVAQLR
jgi:hypothetical protein